MKPTSKTPLYSVVLSFSLKANTYQLLEELSRFDNPAFNYKPEAHQWSAGEIAEHLLLFDLWLNSILQTASKNTQRDPQDKINMITAGLANRFISMENPTRLNPASTVKEPQKLIKQISNSRKKLLVLISHIDLTREYPGTPHPLFGVLSGVEWINFQILYTRRYLEQLQMMK
ncbi:MAG: DinB family protein [Bacteroidetes bacterium]|nr:DinB family protein [Bacteroidota bacterium]